jgi:hypothetical protein
MPAGRHGHKIRKLKRRMDAVLEEERERQKPPPPPISEEHAALRRQIEEVARTIFDPEDPEGTDLLKRVEENAELASVAAKVLMLMREEEELLAAHGVDWHPYQN